VLLGLLALLMLLPVTLPVPVLRGLVADRFEVGELATSTFMSINMVGALLAAPLVGLLADRFGKRRRIVLVALALDALLLFGLTLDVSFGVFMGLRFLEGAVHIAALSMLLSLAADRRSGAVMGLVGAGLTLGVAMGAALGGRIGAEDPLQPLRVGALVLVGAILLAARVLRDRPALHDRPRLSELVELLESRPKLLLPLAFAFVDRFTVGFFTTTFPLYLSGVHGASASRIGILLALLLVPFALLSYPFGRIADRVGRVQLVIGGSLVYGIGAAFVGRLGPDALVWVMPTLGVASAVMFVPNLLLTTDLAPLELRSTAMAGFNAAGSAGFILGPVVGGFVSTRFGYPAAFVVAGASEILCVVLLLRPLARAVR
jgi:MFS family permease